MNYQVLARKWRPRFFREMVGQEHVLQALINALDHNRLHHAYLFTGTRGVGKTTIARILAKCLNCDVGVSSEPCGQCSACQDINNGCFIDLIEVDAASNTGVDDVREIIENAQYRPSRGRYKVYLIDEVHMLSKNAFNALLKTLEEPPEHVKFLLATTDPQKLPATILSRCLQFHLKNMVPERIVGHLQNVLQQEMIECEEPALWALARSAQGSMRDALSLTDQAIAFGSGKVLEKDVRSMLGTIDQQTVYQLAEALMAHNAENILSVIEQFSEQSPDYVGALDELLLLLHRMTIAQIAPLAVDNSLGDKDRVLALAQTVTAEELQLFYQMGLMGKRDMPLAPDSRTGLEMALLRMLVFRPEGLSEPPTKALGTPYTQPSMEAVETVKKPEAVVTTPVVSTPAAPAAVVTASVMPTAISALFDTSSTVIKKAVIDEGKPVVVAAVESPILESTVVAKPVAAAPLQTAVAAVNSPQAAMNSQEKIALKVFTDNQQWISHFARLPFTGLLKSVLAECVLKSVSDNGQSWLLSIDKDKVQLFNERHAGQMAEQLSSYFETPVKVTIQAEITDWKTPAIFMQEVKQAVYDKALAELQQDAGVQNIIKEYSAHIDLNSVEAIQRGG
jgi:DNA polymerase III subunit gamma/tau